MNRYRRIAQQVLLKDSEQPAKSEAAAASGQIAATVAATSVAAPKKRWGFGKKNEAAPEIDFMDQIDGELDGLPDPAGKKKEKPLREPSARKPVNPFLAIKWLFDTLFKIINWISNTALSLVDSLQGILISIALTVLAMIALKHYGYTDFDIIAWSKSMIDKFTKK